MRQFDFKDKCEERGFIAKRKVKWYNPVQLMKTAVKVLVSSIFGTFADRREFQTNGPNAPFFHRNKDELWIDYIADTGDGFHATYSMAYLLAQEQLVVDGKVLPRGDILILGGDQVYPTASRDEYYNRFRGPFESAFPENDNIPSPYMYAVPGNHDWYDGLNSFIKLFTQKRTIGNWKTQQQRSYFALRLPGNWWLWGIDIQPDSDIDGPQLEYFHKIALEHVGEEEMQVILCLADPSWVHYEKGKINNAYARLRFFQKRYIEKIKNVRGGTVAKRLKLRLTLAGDWHHYSSYCSVNKEGEATYKIVSGGGGAFLHPTHHLPREIPDLVDGPFYQKKVYPSVERSQQLLWENLFFGLRNPYLTLLIALVLWVPMALMVPSEMRVKGAQLLSIEPLNTIFSFFTELLVAHLMIGIIIGFTLIALNLLSAYVPFLSTKTWDNLSFSSLGVDDYKNFLRLHITPDKITVYPLKVERICREWSAYHNDAAPRIQPRQELKVELIEEPFELVSK